LLQLFGLLSIIDGECVKISRASNFELGHWFGAGRFRCDFLDACSYVKGTECETPCKYPKRNERTLRIFPPGDFDELLDVADFFGL